MRGTPGRRGIFQRNGWWYADYDDPALGRQKPSLKTKNKEVAMRKYAKLVEDISAADSANPAAHKQWPMCIARYLNWVEREQDIKTLRADANAFRRYEEMFQPKTMADISPDRVNELKWQMEKDGVGMYARERAIRAIKASMNRIEEMEGLPQQNWHRVKNVKLPLGRVVYFVFSEMMQIMASGLKQYMKTVVLLGARAGLRAGEMFHLRWENIMWDFEQYGAIDICPKPDWQPKGGKSRIVPMSKELHDHLLEVQKTAKTPWVIADGTWRPASENCLGQLFSKLLRRIGLKGFLHKLRHTFGADLARAGKSERQIMELMGHSSTKAVQIYMHLQPKDVAHLVNDLNPFS